MRAKIPTVLLPLGAYLVIALLLPVLNGAYARPGFAEHGIAVALVCSVLTLAITLVRRLLARNQLRKKSS